MTKKLHATYILCIALFLSFLFNLYQSNKALKAQINSIRSERQALLDDLKIQGQVNDAYRSEIAGLNKKVSDANLTTKKAKAKLAALPKPKPIEKIESNERVLELINKHYDDSTAKYVNDHFEICSGTTFKMVGDAVNWKINYPVYEQQLQQKDAVINAATTELTAKDLVIGKQNDLIFGLEKSESTQKEVQKSLQLEMKTQKKKTKYYVIGAFVTGFMLKTLAGSK